MLRLVFAIKKTAISSIALFLVLSFPASAVFADNSPPPCTPPPVTSSGVHWPTGSDAQTFTYQCDGQYAGMWTNDHYVYDPTTNQRTPLDPVIYKYNDQTGNWDATVWNYNAAKHVYQTGVISVATPPAGAVTVGGPAPKPTSNTSNSSSPTQNSGINTSTDPSSNLQSTTGASTTQTANSNSSLNNTTNASLNNTLGAQASSGNASVAGNTTGGNATTGNALDVANVINMLQSSSNLFGTNGNLITFTANINGDVNGDLLLNPAQLGAIQPAEPSSTLSNNVTVNNSTNQSIDNTIGLNANSGNADVTSNTTGGNAATGNADAVANIVNVLNSAISGGKSFFGVININGNLNGDILLPANFVDQLLASNVPRTTISTTDLTNNVNVANNTKQAINNAVNTSADTGTATVSGNTSAGSATTGSANTNLTVFNLTGSTVVGSNALLVFVNVLGQWVGLIMNAPTGATAAELGGGIVTNSVDNNTSLTNSTNQTINNNVNVASRSGDATVQNNTTGGDATTGNASASVNLLNLINNNLSFSNWFGLLFINVFGTWHGSFGINTSAGDPVVPPPVVTPSANNPIPQVKVFQFVPSTNETISFVPYSNNDTATPADPVQNAVLAAHTDIGGAGTPNRLSTDQVHHDYWLPIAGVTLAVLMLAGEKIRFFHRSSLV